MFHSKDIFLFILVAVFLASCLSVPDKKIRKLRKDVLSHYTAEEGDKRKAASFLLDNLEKKYFIGGSKYEAYKDSILKYPDDPKTLELKLDQISEPPPDSGYFDIHAFQAEDIIENVNQAIEAWSRHSWKDEVTFSDFCEYILPYRINHEPYEEWRKAILSSLDDSVFSFEDLSVSAEFIIKKLSKKKRYFVVKWGSDNLGIPDLPYSVLDVLSVGSCKELSDYTTFVLRGAGIPCSNDFTPNYANVNSGHTWNALILSPTESIPFIIPVEDTLGNFKSEHFKLAKVYRNTFSIQEKSHAYQNKHIPFLPAAFNNPYIKDVTEQYVEVKDIKMLGEDMFFEPERFAYLSVFDNNKWVPVAWGKVSGQTALFKKVGVDAVYLPMGLEEGYLTPFSYPFIFDQDGNRTMLKPNDSLITLEILRKYPLFPMIQKFIDRMIGGEFQGANRPDFSDAVTLYKINESPGAYFNEVELKEPDRFRFIRYQSPASSWCNIAELEVYSNDDITPLSGEIIGTEGINEELPHRTKETVFDGDVLTFFQAPQYDSCWVGLAFDKPQKIDRLRFIARTGYNIIVPGNEYEVFYWDNQWVSLGRKIPEGHILTYTDVPSGALYYIQNHTEGKQERIFTYEDGKQVWW